MIIKYKPWQRIVLLPCLLLFTFTRQGVARQVYQPQKFQRYTRSNIWVTDFTLARGVKIPDWAVPKLANLTAAYLDNYYNPKRFTNVYRTTNFDRTEAFLVAKMHIVHFTDIGFGGNYPVYQPLHIVGRTIKLTVTGLVIEGRTEKPLGQAFEAEYVIREDDEWAVAPLEDLLSEVARRLAIELGEEKYRR